MKRKLTADIAGIDFEICPICKRKFKLNCSKGITSMIVLAFIDGKYVDNCPLCYAERYNEMHDANWNPDGKLASIMFEEAKRQYPNWGDKK